ncbi:MAG: tRNA pseudouridine synthase A, partial [Actinobacteria bacterium]|nr:tRNA pseudouridine synthase A [Actinomycetota bacterium]
AGRTDKGVHALGQVVSVDVADDVDVDVVELARRVNRIVGPEIAVRDAQVVPLSFDARFSARSRTYRYVVWNRSEPDPFRAGLAWHVAEPLDLAALRLACDPFIGSHDFSAFCRVATRRDGSPAPLTRRVIAADWKPGVPGEIVFTITASSFCHQMVRSIVGTIVEVGRGRRSAGDLVGVIASGDRSRAGRLAPPDGLYLESVDYGDAG